MELMRSVWKALVKFLRPEAKIYIIETSKTRVPVVEDEESIRSLATHPGFVQLVNRFKLQQIALENQVRMKQNDIRDYDRIQLGLEWAGFYERQVNASVFKKKEAQAVQVQPTELIEFKRVYAQLEGV